MNNTQKKYFLVASIILICNSLFASQVATGSKAASGSHAQSAVKVATDSSGAAAAVNKQENEYDVKVTAEHTVLTITKTTVLTHNPTGQILKEIIVFSKKEKNPFKQILSSKIEGLRSLYPILTVYKEALMIHRIKEFEKEVAKTRTTVDLSEFSHGASNGTFDFKNPQ